MSFFTQLDIIALALATIHFGAPLTYYLYMKSKYLNKPWNTKVNENYEPKVTIIIPTYNEAKLIERKLDNIYKQKYPRNKLEVIVVDSASIDGTPRKVLRWTKNHPDIVIKLIEEPERKGMAHALRTGFNHAKGDVVIVTDADALWASRETLKEVMKWLSDDSIGAVSCIKVPVGGGSIENTYRRHYNILRIAESKAWSTPIFHGELSAFKRKLLEEVGGFPFGVGSAESLAAMRIAALGYRVIIPNTIIVQELVPRDSYVQWRIRRAQHLILHLVKTLTYLIKSYNSTFWGIILMEAYLHTANPWLLLLSLVLFLYSTLMFQSILGLSIIALGIVLLMLKPYRTWILNQILLMVAQIRNLRNKELVWRKQRKSLSSYVSLYGTCD